MGNKRLIITAMVVAAIATLLLCIPSVSDDSDATAVEEVVLSVDSANLRKVGDDISVTLNMDSNPGISSIRLNVYYDNELLSLKEVEWHMEDLSSTETNVEKYPVSIYAESADIDSLATSTGKMATLTFSSDASMDILEGQFPVIVTLQECLYESSSLVFENRPVSIISSTVVVGNILKGDVSNDGKITSGDSLMLRKYLAGHDVPSIDKYMDMNLDERVSSVDSLLLRKHLAGHNVNLGTTPQRVSATFVHGDDSILIQDVVKGMNAYVYMFDGIKSIESDNSDINLMVVEHNRYSFSPVDGSNVLSLLDYYRGFILPVSWQSEQNRFAYR